MKITVKKPRTPAVFFLRFPSEQAARETGTVLEQDGFTVTVEAEPSHWLLHARAGIRPDSFDVAERSLEALAAAKGGVLAGYRREA